MKFKNRLNAGIDSALKLLLILDTVISVFLMSIKSIKKIKILLSYHIGSAVVQTVRNICVRLLHRYGQTNVCIVRRD